jgi:hypothetical protein
MLVLTTFSYNTATPLPTCPVQHCFYCLSKLDGTSCICGAVCTKRRFSEWRSSEMCKCINKMTCIVLFYRRFPTHNSDHKSRLSGVLTQSTCSTWANCSRRHEPVGRHDNCRRCPSRPFLPPDISFTLREGAGRRAHQPASVREYRPALRLLGCRNSGSAVGDNDPGSVGAGSGLALFHS